jgi:hypothetical protein
MCVIAWSSDHAKLMLLRFQPSNKREKFQLIDESNLNFNYIDNACMAAEMSQTANLWYSAAWMFLHSIKIFKILHRNTYHSAINYVIVLVISRKTCIKLRLIAGIYFCCKNNMGWDWNTEEYKFKVLQTNDFSLAFITAFSCSQSYWRRYQQQQSSCRLDNLTSTKIALNNERHSIYMSMLVYFEEEAMGSLGTRVLITRIKMCNWIWPHWMPASSMGHQTSVFGTPRFWIPNHFALLSQEFSSFSLFLLLLEVG